MTHSFQRWYYISVGRGMLWQHPGSVLASVSRRAFATSPITSKRQRLPGIALFGAAPQSLDTYFCMTTPRFSDACSKPTSPGIWSTLVAPEARLSTVDNPSHLPLIWFGILSLNNDVNPCVVKWLFATWIIYFVIHFRLSHAVNFFHSAVDTIAFSEALVHLNFMSYVGLKWYHFNEAL
jgi:hypothetical protein